MVIFHKRGFDSYLDSSNYKRQTVGSVWVSIIPNGYYVVFDKWRYCHANENNLGLWKKGRKWVSGLIASCHNRSYKYRGLYGNIS